MQQPNITYEDITNKLSISRKNVSERIKSLNDKGIIERREANRTGYWKVNSK